MNAKEGAIVPGRTNETGIVTPFGCNGERALRPLPADLLWRQRPLGNSSASCFANTRSISMPISPSCGELMNLISSMLS
jgi:hypothetical protein